MFDCIFTPHCTEQFCDKSCPILVETAYLLERNGIDMNSPVFHELYPYVDRILNILAKNESGVQTIIASSKDSIKVSDFVTYCEICKNWKGSRLHCTVYNLRYSRYLDDVKKSWSMKSETEDLEYRNIWIYSSKVLIISSLDYVKFGDFETQKLLTILQQRQSSDKKTIVISPPLERLATGSSGGSFFFDSMKQILNTNKVGTVELK